MEIKGSTVLVTGAGSGIGEATAKYFAKLGAKVAVVDLGKMTLIASSRTSRMPVAKPLEYRRMSRARVIPPSSSRRLLKLSGLSILLFPAPALFMTEQC